MLEYSSPVRTPLYMGVDIYARYGYRKVWLGQRPAADCYKRVQGMAPWPRLHVRVAGSVFAASDVADGFREARNLGLASAVNPI